jgi:hypothetical protein
MITLLKQIHECLGGELDALGLITSFNVSAV